VPLVRRSSHEVRSELGTLLRQSPSELGTILALDPTLLSHEAFLAGYPELSRFVAEHPEVRRNPRFYLAEFAPTAGDSHHLIESLTILGVFALTALVAAWLIRTIIEQRRWSRLSRTQSEVHNKILERFGTSEALLEYMRSPAGARFLESAPIPLHVERAPLGPPLARAMLSIQVGVIVALGAVGMIAVSGRFDPDGAQDVFSLGVIILFVGLGFIASAVVSLVLSRRLGLWPGATGAARESAEAETARY
jgi:hypothetical protein